MSSKKKITAFQTYKVRQLLNGAASQSSNMIQIDDIIDLNEEENNIMYPVAHNNSKPEFIAE